MDDSPNRVESVSQAAFDSLTRSTAPKPTSDQVADPPGRLNGGNAAEDDDDEDSGIDRNESRKRKLEREENPPDNEESLAGPSETKKKKKKKKDKREREEDASAAMAVEASEPEIPPSPPKKKKKKKKKSKPEERESMNEEPSESFPVIKDKKKKRKQKEMGDETDGLNSEIPQDDEERQKLTQALLSSPSVTLNSKDKKKKRKKDGKALEALEAAQKKAELNEARVKEAERKKKEEEAAAEAKAKELEMMRLKQKEAAEARVREAEKKRKEEEEEAERKRKILEEERKKMEEDQKWAQEIATRFALKGPLNLKESKTVNATHPMSSSEDEATAPKPSPQSSKKAAPKPSPSKKAAPKRTRSKSVAKSSVTAAPATPAPTVQTDLSATVNAPETSVESQADLQHQLLASMSTKMGSGSKGRKKKSKSTPSGGNPASQLIQSICGTPVPVFKSTPSGKQSKLRSAAWATPTGNGGSPEKQVAELIRTDSVEDVKSSLQADLIASMLSKTTPKKKKK